MGLFLLRMTLTPALVLLVSLVQRRWGHGLGGRLVGLPLTTGPLVFLIWLQDGPYAASTAAHGVVAGQVGVVAYCVAYAHLCRRLLWWQVLPLAWLATFLSVAALQGVASTWVAAGVVVGATVVALRSWPRFPGGSSAARRVARWEAPVRAVVTGFLVATLTGLSRVLGPHLAGLLASTPVILSVLGPATQRGAGPAAAAELLRGTTTSIAGSTMFSAVVAATVVPLGWVSFVVAVGALVLTDLVTGWARTRTAAHPSSGSAHLDQEEPATGRTSWAVMP